jgi:hypothetical protein
LIKAEIKTGGKDGEQASIAQKALIREVFARTFAVTWSEEECGSDNIICPYCVKPEPEKI